MVVVCHWPPLEQNYSPSDITATLLTDFGKGAKLHVYSAVVVDIAQCKNPPCTHTMCSTYQVQKQREDWCRTMVDQWLLKPEDLMPLLMWWTSAGFEFLSNQNSSCVVIYLPGPSLKQHQMHQMHISTGRASTQVQEVSTWTLAWGRRTHGSHTAEVKVRLELTG